MAAPNQANLAKINSKLNSSVNEFRANTGKELKELNVALKELLKQTLMKLPEQAHGSVNENVQKLLRS